MALKQLRSFIDIGANLTDLMYNGIYNGSKKHEVDLQHVLKRSWDCGLSKIIVTGGSLDESARALELAQSDSRLYSTVGCHPTRCLEFEKNDNNPFDYLDNLKNLAQNGVPKVVAIGECGLDYDRLNFCPKDIQIKYFDLQLQLSQSLSLPLFLHCRNAAHDLQTILAKYTNLKGVVHSFDGTLEDATMFINMGFYIGLNGCSLKTEDNLKTVCGIPNDKILIETDCPWCEIRPSHAGYKHISKENQVIPSVKKKKWKMDCMVKSRNEPVNICQVLDVIAAIKNENPNELAKTIFNNTETLFDFN